MKNFKAILQIASLLFININIYSQLQHVNMEATSKWSQGFDGITKIKVFWENPSSDNYNQRQLVKQAIEETWSPQANVDFIGWEKYDNSGTGIRIFLDDYSHPHTKGLGNQLNGMYKGMVLNFNFWGDFKCSSNTIDHCIKAIAVHEFGHALGIAHEQNRPDCQCAQYPENSGSSGGYYVTPCDLFSVMNYCNPKWNNNGKLSQYDIEGIQAVYGTRKAKIDRGENSGFSTAIDKLGNNQIWENLILTIGNQQFVYNINMTNKEEIKTFKFVTTGSYHYEISSVSLHTDDKTYHGFGSGTLEIDNTKNYKIEVFAKTPQNYPNFEIYIEAKDINSEKRIVNKKKDEGDDRLGGISTDNKQNFLRNGQKPIHLLLLNSVPMEKFYVYSDGVIMVYSMKNNTFFKCGKTQASNYKDWNGRVWAWTFDRKIENNLKEQYTVSTTGEVWAMNKDDYFSQFGYVTSVDF